MYRQTTHSRSHEPPLFLTSLILSMCSYFLTENIASNASIYQLYVIKNVDRQIIWL